MLEQIQEQMLQNGYQPVQTSIPEVKTFYKYYQNIYYCVCIVDDRNGYLQGMGKMGYLIQCSKDLFTQSGHSCQVLGVIVTSNVALSRSRAQGAGWVWYADIVSGHLLVFDDQPGSFLDARYCLEEGIAREAAASFGGYGAYGQRQYWQDGSTSFARRETRRRSQKTFELTPVNTMLIAVNVLVFLFLEIEGDTQDAQFLHNHGGMSVYKLVEEKDWLCLLTSAFVHAGLEHLLSNMLVLAAIGDNVERALGKWKYITLYLVSAVGANLLSAGWYYVIRDPFVVSVGASGAIFGVIGGLLYMVCKNRGRLEDMTTPQIGIFILISLFHGFQSVSVNNMAHMGGLAIGILVSALLYRNSLQTR